MALMGMSARLSLDRMECQVSHLGVGQDREIRLMHAWLGTSKAAALMLTNCMRIAGYSTTQQALSFRSIA